MYRKKKQAKAKSDKAPGTFTVRVVVTEVTAATASKAAIESVCHSSVVTVLHLHKEQCCFLAPRGLGLQDPGT